MFRKKLIIALMCVFGAISLTACEGIENSQNVATEKIKGTSYTAKVFDSYGNNTFNVTGKRISLDVLDESFSFLKTTDNTYQSSVLDVTIDGQQMLMVGDTVVFEEKGLDMITNFSIDDIQSESGGSGLQFIDRFINNYSNMIGKAKTVVISSQLGVPIGVYQGNSVYVEVPDDLPKTTRLSIDGKSLYIHRANYQIIDSSLIK